MPFNPKSLQNLKIIKKGDKVNRGRKKGSISLKRIIKEELGNDIDEEYLKKMTPEMREKFKGKSKAYVGVFHLISDFLHGDIRAAKLILETIEGKPAVSNNISVGSVTHEELIKEFRGTISNEEFEEILYDDSQDENSIVDRIQSGDYHASLSDEELK